MTRRTREWYSLIFIVLSVVIIISGLMYMLKRDADCDGSLVQKWPWGWECVVNQHD
jgi:hypothetical protein